MKNRGLDQLGRRERQIMDIIYRRGSANAAEVLADPFNCLGRFRDGEQSACGELVHIVRQGSELTRAYKTPSLRGAAGRPRKTTTRRQDPVRS